jgi:hypothetical protein
MEMKQIELGLTHHKIETTTKEIFICIFMIAYLVVALFSIHLEGDGIFNLFAGALIFGLFPSFEEFRSNNWYLVEWSQWALPLLLLATCITIICIAFAELKKTKITKEHVLIGFLISSFLGFITYSSIDYALNF